MAEIDYTVLLLPVFLAAILSGAITWIILAVNKFSRMGTSTVTGSIRIEGLKEELDEVKNTVRESISEMEKALEKKEEYFREEWNRTWARIEDHGIRMKLAEYRLDEIQHKKNGGSKGAV